MLLLGILIHCWHSLVEGCDAEIVLGQFCFGGTPEINVLNSIDVGAYSFVLLRRLMQSCPNGRRDIRPIGVTGFRNAFHFAVFAVGAICCLMVMLS